MAEVYCLKCRKYTENKNPSVSHVSNRWAMFPGHAAHCLFM